MIVYKYNPQSQKINQETKHRKIITIKVMESQSQPKIPVIDMSNERLKPDTSVWQSASKEIRNAFEEFGCFEAIYRKVPLELHNYVFATAAELFDLSTEIKMKNKSSKTYFDYFGQYASLPLYESLAIDNPTSLESTQSFTNLMWPSGNQHFWSDVIYSFIHDRFGLTIKLCVYI